MEGSPTCEEEEIDEVEEESSFVWRFLESEANWDENVLVNVSQEGVKYFAEDDQSQDLDGGLASDWMIEFRIGKEPSQEADNRENNRQVHQRADQVGSVMGDGFVVFSEPVPKEVSEADCDLDVDERNKGSHDVEEVENVEASYLVRNPIALEEVSSKASKGTWKK